MDQLIEFLNQLTPEMQQQIIDTISNTLNGVKIFGISINSLLAIWIGYYYRKGKLISMSKMSSAAKSQAYGEVAKEAIEDVTKAHQETKDELKEVKGVVLELGGLVSMMMGGMPVSGQNLIEAGKYLERCTFLGTEIVDTYKTQIDERLKTESEIKPFVEHKE